mmetsp:Transcript_29368/g.70627  ORF Transcript_29368/g.70627 Transcript_29368/m.70627 type:complete len:147 (+) Transcript_29368:30-470(+)
MVEASERSVVVVDAKDRCSNEDLAVGSGDCGERLPPLTIDPHEPNEGDEKLAAEGLDAKAKSAVAARCRNRFLGWLTSLVMVDNMNFELGARFVGQETTMSSSIVDQSCSVVVVRIFPPPHFSDSLKTENSITGRLTRMNTKFPER